MRNPDRETVFRFKQFMVANRQSAMKVGTDGVLLGAWSLSGDGQSISPNTPPERILDVGCGTGLIALMMAQRFPAAFITGIEIDPVAADEASMNFKSSPWSGRLTVIEGDFNQQFPETGSRSFDLIVSNPPFFNNGELSPDNARLTARHECSLSLESLLRTSSRILAENGYICLIMPSDRAEEIKYRGVINRLALTRMTWVSTVPSKPPRRVLVELRHESPTGQSVKIDHLSIHDGYGGLTDEYISLVKDFYLKL